MDNKEWKYLRLGVVVDIILKHDQRTGRIIRGVVKDILTKFLTWWWLSHSRPSYASATLRPSIVDLYSLLGSRDEKASPHRPVNTKLLRGFLLRVKSFLASRGFKEFASAAS
jgi:hypothetical protein